MKTPRLFPLTCLLLAPILAQASGVVIVNQANKTDLDPLAIQHLFLGRSAQLGRQAMLVPVLPDDDAEVTQAFYRKVLGKSRARYRAYWAKRVFTSDGVPPQEFDSEAVIQCVIQNVDCIGVVADHRIREAEVRVIHDF
jgi:hypothetical protein